MLVREYLIPMVMRDPPIRDIDAIISNSKPACEYGNLKSERPHTARPTIATNVVYI